ncbi:hypothetical protein D3C87_1505010 [compost metagenome]
MLFLYFRLSFTENPFAYFLKGYFLAIHQDTGAVDLSGHCGSTDETQYQTGCGGQQLPGGYTKWYARHHHNR